MLLLCSILAAMGLARADDGSAFITTWEITEADEEIMIPTAPDTDYDFTIDWGDGTVEEISGTDPDPTHARAFNQDLSGWTFSEEANTDDMFEGAEAFEVAHAPDSFESR